MHSKIIIFFHCNRANVELDPGVEGREVGRGDFAVVKVFKEREKVCATSNQSQLTGMSNVIAAVYPKCEHQLVQTLFSRAAFIYIDLMCSHCHYFLAIGRCPGVRGDAYTALKFLE
ncbi:hypothetical protein PsorP6_006757 [Peronosclerospora sorghi]|uniref:Uncharacterized protein n=1 Tax=Peronosclerospora sorghi TaxID=230839 RepID=A0ACC0W5V1_9STRA|nr:hypothetical protein PsorP6_006757 [Peronosclerospora sorghi]